MPKFYDSISPDLIDWCLEQPAFWTASAPIVGAHINVSPKGMLGSAFSFLTPNTAAYIDLNGSGSETIAHLYENGRVTVMFSSFQTSPRILRLFCTGRVLESGSAGFDEMLARMRNGEKWKGELLVTPRAIVALDIFKVQTTCGFGVPVIAVATSEENGEMKPCFTDRKTLAKWASFAAEKGEMAEYQRVWNSNSLDGLPGLRLARRRNKMGVRVAGSARAWVRRALMFPDVLLVGVLVGLGVGVASRGLMSGGFLLRGSRS